MSEKENQPTPAKVGRPKSKTEKVQMVVRVKVETRRKLDILSIQRSKPGASVSLGQVIDELTASS